MRKVSWKLYILKDIDILYYFSTDPTKVLNNNSIGVCQNIIIDEDNAENIN
jgi:hypothetical protein